MESSYIKLDEVPFLPHIALDGADAAIVEKENHSTVPVMLFATISFKQFVNHG